MTAGLLPTADGGRATARVGQRALAAGTAVAASHGNSSDADRLRAIERTRLQALVDADTATARKVTAPDFQLINPAGGVFTREDYM